MSFEALNRIPLSPDTSTGLLLYAVREDGKTHLQTEDVLNQFGFTDLLITRYKKDHSKEHLYDLSIAMAPPTKNLADSIEIDRLEMILLDLISSTKLVMDRNHVRFSHKGQDLITLEKGEPVIHKSPNEDETLIFNPVEGKFRYMYPYFPDKSSKGMMVSAELDFRQDRLVEAYNSNIPFTSNEFYMKTRPSAIATIFTSTLPLRFRRL